MTGSADNCFLAAFRRLAVTQGLMPGALQSGRQLEFVVLTAAATLVFTRGREYAETEVNALLKDWLAGPGAMLATDHVELRRCLIDCRLLVRDGFGRRYARGAAPEGWHAALSALDDVDLAAEARTARNANAERRAERKAQWAHRTPAAGAGSDAGK